MSDAEKREYWRKWREKRRQEALRTMSRELKNLIRFTKTCREDMHEPDENGISATVIGDHLDNAFGTAIFAEGRHYQEFVVTLRNGKGETLEINLASLIALARKAKIG